MRGLMMEMPLLVSDLIRHADRHHGDTPIVSRRVEGDLHRYTYREAHTRARQAANALARLGLGSEDRVATLAWNGYRHFEIYYAVAGSGRVMHTINPRLFPEQIAWILNDAKDKALFLDLTFLPLVQKILPACEHLKHVVLMTDRAHMPAEAKGFLCYEDLLEAESGDYAWPTLDENTACGLCYTSGTTGNPKGALYSHRSTVLHAYAICLPDAMALSARDCALPVVPMFHANAWGLPFAAPLVGAKVVFPGAALDGKSLHALFESEGVTFSAGVPDGVGRPHPVHARERRAAHDAETHRDRRGGLPARDDPRARGRVRHRGEPRLGDDRDVSARERLQAEGEALRAARRGAAGDPARSRGASCSASTGRSSTATTGSSRGTAWRSATCTCAARGW